MPVAGIACRGALVVPPDACGLVVFAHGSPQASPRNPEVVSRFQQRGLATMVLELWTSEEVERERRDATFRIDTAVLADRLLGALDGIAARGLHRDLPIGVFGGGDCGTAAVIAAALRPDRVAAIACRDGQLDIAGSALAALRVPTMLIAGSNDLRGVQAARATVRAPVVVVISDSNQQFEQPGALAQVATTAGRWFVDQLARGRAATAHTASSA